MTDKARGFFCRFRLFALAVALMAPLAACNHGECSSCDGDEDCESGRTCAPFNDGNSYCADQDTDECRV